ncbi:hypothetical protein ASPCAL06222 [Aspergillus calidoustus]|uniref:Uncharacterized protein n=1 Tax=Aspergillus calidoustus TaxID=454130 RepID=A0A0U5G3C8_ASPCI|nr:hypothetical protein ASPCAL06222 [Aspergillus calidoustus]
MLRLTELGRRDAKLMIEIARDSRSVALSTTRGSTSMRVTAATFTATWLSLIFFSSLDAGSLKASPWIWIYVVTDLKNNIPLQNPISAPTKLVQHWYTKAISAEDNQLTTFPINPSFVATNLGDRAANLLGMEPALVTVEDSAAGAVVVCWRFPLQYWSYGEGRSSYHLSLL